MARSDNTFSLIGKPVRREDGLEKVTGQTKFADDYHMPHQLTGIMLRLPVSHARIKKIDLSSLEKDNNIVAVCDHHDIPGAKKVGVVHFDQPIFCYEKIVTPGDVVAMALGESEEKIIAALPKARIDFEPLPVLTDPRKALEKDAPLIHPEKKNNLIVHHPLRKGDIKAGFAASDFIIEQTYTTQAVEHAYLEPECVLAYLREGNKGIHVLGSIQNPFTTRNIVARVLGWPLNRVRIQQAELGGSFGGKDDLMDIIAARAAIGAVKTGRPVKIRYRREDSIRESYKRHPYIMKYKVGFTKRGKIKAMKIDILADGGAYASMSPFVTWRTVVQATGPYDIENVRTDVRAVYTNNPYTGAMRGFGSPQPIFAQESIIDEIALYLGKTPVEIRRINALKAGSLTATGHKLTHHDVNLIKVLTTASSKTNFSGVWKKNLKVNHHPGQLNTNQNYIAHDFPFSGKSGYMRKGIGLAVSLRGCSLGAEGIDASAAYISVQNDGTVYLLSGLAENGQGMRTTYGIIAAEVLGIHTDSIQYLDMDTGYIADSGPTVASRATLMGGSAVKNAAEIIRSRLENVLRKTWKLTGRQNVIFKKNMVSAQGVIKKISFPELCYLAYQKGVNLAAIGWYPGPKVEWDEKSGQGPAYFTYVYGCQVAEIHVNMITGEVYVDRVTAVHDPGKVINLLGAQGQVYGGVTQGAGYALWEEISSHQGFIRELNFDQFLIPTSKDISDIVPVFVEGKDRYGPWGAKSLAEPTLELTAAAIANAVRNATGKRFFSLPINLEEIILERKLYPHDTKRGSDK